MALAIDDPEGMSPPPRPTPAEMEAALTPAVTAHADQVPTDPAAAQELPHRDLDRSEVLDLMEGVFGDQLDMPAGMFDEFEPSRFLSDETAVVAANDLPESTESDNSGSVLLQSSGSLRTETPSGGEAPIDLALEHSEGELQPANPVVEVGIPQALGEGIELPDLGIRIYLQDAPSERAPSAIRDSVAAYPEVAEDTSLAVAPTTGGLETMTLLQSADSPTSQTFELDLPGGATLERSPKGGGAEVVRDGKQILDISAPTAIDATGADVPVSFDISGDSLTLEVEPATGASFPILVDPIFTSMTGPPALPGWISYSTTPYYAVTDHATCTNAASPYSCGPGLSQNAAGAYIAGLPGPAIPAGNSAGWEYRVPRYAEEYARIGKPPASYIVSATEEGVGFWHRADATPSPMYWTGIWAPVTGAWVSGDGLSGSGEVWGNGTLNYGAGQNTNGKIFAFSMSNMDGHGLGAMRDFHANHLNVWIADNEAPKWGTPPVMPWSKGEGESPTIPLSATDNGLGVYEIVAYYQGKWLGWVREVNITPCGGAEFTCPYEWSTPARPSPRFQLSQLPQGISNVELQAEDPVGNKSSMMNATFRIDRTAPVLGSLSGTLTEQTKLGTTLPQYTLQASATDGTEASAQSGVVKAEVKVDGTIKPALTKTQTCETKNCSMTPSWTLNASEFTAGEHEISVVFTDGVERKSTSTALKVKFGPDVTKPAMSVTGALKEAPEGWVEQQTYTVPVTATDTGGYGVKQLKLLIDEKVVSQTATTACPAGGCSKSATFSVNAAKYTGGAHEVEVQALDWATSTNIGVSKWTMNVNPKGQIPNSEASETIEAVEETAAETQVITPTPEAISQEEREAGNDPSLIQEGEGIESVGTPAPISLTDPAGGVEIEGADGVIEVTPIGMAGGTNPTIVHEISAVSSDAFTSTDTTLRPKFNGCDGLPTHSGADRAGSLLMGTVTGSWPKPEID
ncbi:MAG TPA: hypothetical protein VFJ57_11765 [Solirubrobacterales bacterium]|nr:hypothetical protein [Solirubrobacterales bacterium]